jgi:hypothetical protein
VRDFAGSVIRVRSSYHEGVLSTPKSGLRFHDLRHNLGTQVIAKADVASCSSRGGSELSALLGALQAIGHLARRPRRQIVKSSLQDVLVAAHYGVYVLRRRCCSADQTRNEDVRVEDDSHRAASRSRR